MEKSYLLIAMRNIIILNIHQLKTSTMENLANDQPILVCEFHEAHSQNLISVFIKDLKAYAFLKKDIHNKWWLTSLTYRILPFKKKTQKITLFRESFSKKSGVFEVLRKRWYIFSKFSLSKYKEIMYSERAGSGIIMKKDLIGLPAL